MKHWVYLSGVGKHQLIYHQVYLFHDLEGSISFWSYFGQLMQEFEVGSF